MAEIYRGLNVSDDQGSEIIRALHEHDVRLVRVEGIVGTLDRDMTAQAGRMDRASEKLEQLAEAVSALGAGQKMILLIVGTGIPLIAGMELWDRLSK